MQVMKKPVIDRLLLRREGSNLRPSGYEPDELPLLYFAMWTAKVQSHQLIAKEIFALAYLCRLHESRIC
jgi:hypothetical protein